MSSLSPSPRDITSFSREETLIRLLHLRGRNHSFSISQEESKFLNRWKEMLPPEEWAAYLLSWSRALNSYGTPSSIINEIEYVNHSFTIGDKRHPAFSVKGGVYASRRTLMKKQAPYFPKNSPETYPHALCTDDCFLCQNIAQSIDCERDHRSGSNAILDLGEYIVLPNRYPAHPGAALFMRKDHDQYSLRNPLPFSSGEVRREASERTTFGNILSSTDLETLIWLCDTLHLVGMRNHPLDGMSIPLHDHTHLMPESLAPTFVAEALLKPPALQDSALFFPTMTPFSTLAISGSSPKEIAHTAAPLLEALERANIIASFTYIKRHLLITPRKGGMVPIAPAVGAGISIHLFDPTEYSALASVNERVPLHGEFEWNRFLH